MNDERDITESARDRQIKSDGIHHKALFDALNEALDQERPYKYKG
jgi:hypothetical protein